jgi:hypothetical protein
MSLLFQRMLRAARLEAALYEEVEADPSAIGHAMLTVVLASVAAGIGSALLGPGAILMAVVTALIGWYIWAVLAWLIGTRLLPEPQTQADLGQLLRTTGFASAPGVLRVLGFLPGLGGFIVAVAQVWMLAAMIVAVRQALDYRGIGRAVAVCLIGWVVYVVLSVFLTIAFGGLNAVQVP